MFQKGFMPIISSVPALGAITKGSPATFTLDKAELLLVPSVAASPYYSISTNWRSVILNYQSSTGNQPEEVVFDATQISPTGIFEVVSSALDIFNIQSILIVDFQGGFFIVPRSELNVVDFDVDMSPVGGVEWDITGPYTLQPNGGLTTTNVATYDNQYAPSDIKAGDFDITFTFASNPTDDAAAGMVTDALGFYGFIGFSGGAVGSIFFNNVGPQSNAPFLIGVENIFRMTRVGTTVVMYMNGSAVASTTFAGNLRPIINMHPSDVLTSAVII